MEENLKTIRLAHQVVLAISSAILAFALSPDQRSRYEAALMEIKTIRSLRFDEYASFVSDEFRSQNPATVQNVFNEYADLSSGIGGFRIVQAIAFQYPLYIEWPEPDSSLATYLEFFERDVKAVAIFGAREKKPARNAVELATKSLTRVGTESGNQAMRPGRSTITLDTISFAIPSKKSGFAIGTRGTGLEPLIFAGLPPEDLREVTLRLALTGPAANGEANNLVGTAEVVPFLYERVGPEGKNWLISRPAADAFGETGEAKDPFFKHVRDFSNQIGPMKPDEAMKFLQDKLDSMKREISFLGVTVEEGVAVWAGPLVLLVVVAFLLSHVRNISVTIDDERRMLASFPWISLFPDSLSKTFAYVSIGILPSLSTGLLLERFGRWPEITSVLAGTFLCMIIWSSIFTLAEIGRLRQIRELARTQANGTP